MPIVHPRSRSTILVSGFVLLGGMLGAGPAAGSAGPSASAASTISRSGVTVRVPAPGEGVAAFALRANGPEAEIEVRTDRLGRVTIHTGPRHSDPDSEAEHSPAGSPSACSDSAYKLKSYWQKSKFHWEFKAPSTPAGISQGSAETEIEAAVANITNADNDCGMADHVSAKSEYDGRTLTRGAGIKSDSSCGAKNGYNTVAFGNLAAGDLGLACIWFTGSRVDEADIRFNSTDYDFATSVGSCTNAYILEAVATHEFGHAYGLAHVSESSHGNLTMSTTISTCSAFAQSLGKGDVLALEDRY